MVQKTLASKTDKITNETTPIEKEEATSKLAMPAKQWLYMGSNSRSRGVRLRALGWKPEGPSVFEVMGDEADIVLKKKGLA